MKKILLTFILFILVLTNSFSFLIKAEDEYTWIEENGKFYWYENGVKQATEKSKEIYDPASDAWYYLDSNDGGAKATNKEIYLDTKDYQKWIRVDNDGKMIEGWFSVKGDNLKYYPDQEGKTYYYDPSTKEKIVDLNIINGVICLFDKDGVLIYKDISHYILIAIVLLCLAAFLFFKYKKYNIVFTNKGFLFEESNKLQSIAGILVLLIALYQIFAIPWRTFPNWPSLNILGIIGKLLYLVLFVLLGIYFDKKNIVNQEDNTIKISNPFVYFCKYFIPVSIFVMLTTFINQRYYLRYKTYLSSLFREYSVSSYILNILGIFSHNITNSPIIISIFICFFIFLNLKNIKIKKYYIALPFVIIYLLYIFKIIDASTIYDVPMICLCVIGFIIGLYFKNIYDIEKINIKNDKVNKYLSYIGRNWLAFLVVSEFVTALLYNLAVDFHIVRRRIIIPNGLIAIVAVLLLTPLITYIINIISDNLVSTYKNNKKELSTYCMIGISSILLRLSLEISNNHYDQFAHYESQQWPINAILNMFTIVLIIMLFNIIINKWSISTLIVSILLTILAIVNHYTIEHHGTMLTAEDIDNIGVFMNVVGGYSFQITTIAFKILMIYAVIMVVIILHYVYVDRKKKRAYSFKKILIQLSIIIVSFYLIYLSPYPLIRKNNNIWTWHELYAKNGYLAGTIQSTLANAKSVVRKPEGYSDEIVNDIISKYKKDNRKSNDYPDIVLILNETYYNLDNYYETGADVDYMKNYNSLQNAIKGYAVTPIVGGGTNCSEYELLTSNSADLMGVYAPFNRLQLADAASIIKTLKELGYYTMFSHPHESNNYRRGISFNKLGIDESHFIDEFVNQKFYANRNYDNRLTDKSAFDNFVNFYENMPDDNPKFAYLLTIQNHGGWLSNKEDGLQDLVRAKEIEEDEFLSRKINEYLSCIKLTDDMIPVMTDYFKQSKRKTVICMVGDHSPSFIGSLPVSYSDSKYQDILKRSTPFFIWANYDIETSEDIKYLDLNYLMPYLFETIGLPQSQYYQYLNNMRNNISVFTSVSEGYYDQDMNYRPKNTSTDAGKLLHDYYYLEYNNIGKDAKQYNEIFLP